MGEIAENAVEDLLTVNSTEKSDNWDENSEFFHNKDEYGISEFTGCKSLLYKTIGDSESGYKVYVLCINTHYNINSFRFGIFFALYLPF